MYFNNLYDHFRVPSVPGQAILKFILTLTGERCNGPCLDPVNTHKTEYSWEQNPPPCLLMGEVNIAMMYVLCAEGKQHTSEGSGVDRTCTQ